MTIGQLLKQYRIENLKTQKEWAGNVISQSYYSKVEKDQNRITADDLIALLHFNNVKLWDFLSKLSQEDKIQYNEGLNIGQEINEAYYHLLHLLDYHDLKVLVSFYEYLLQLY